MSGLRVVPVSGRQAGEFIAMWHRTHPNPPVGMKFSAGVANDLDVLVGVVVVGRPVARNLDDGLTLEITRAATDATEHANSKLYAAAARAAKALGFWRVITYTQAGESGASLRAAGFVVAETLSARAGWDCQSRPARNHGNDHIVRYRWERICNQDARPWQMPSRPPNVTAIQDGLFGPAGVGIP